jgi:hypothetical protein
MPKTSSTEKAHRAATKAKHAQPPPADGIPSREPNAKYIEPVWQDHPGFADRALIAASARAKAEASEAAKLLTWARANGFPLLRVKVGEVELELGVSLPPPAPPSAPRTRMTPPGPADTRNLYEAFGGEALERAREAMGIDDDGDPEDDDEPAIPHPRDRRPRRR